MIFWKNETKYRKRRNTHESAKFCMDQRACRVEDRGGSDRNRYEAPYGSVAENLLSFPE
jgi:hypothetical protein